MNKILLSAVCIFFAGNFTRIQAQSWADWEEFQAHVTKKWIWRYPKNIEKFQIAYIKNWSNGNWKDSIRLTHVYNAAGLPQSRVTHYWDLGQWSAGNRYSYYYDAQNRLASMVEGDSLRTDWGFYNRYDTAGRLQTARIEATDILGWGWHPFYLDSSVYALSGLKTHHYNFKWNIARWNWEQVFKDSFIYGANGRLTTVFRDYPQTNPPYFDVRLVLDYTATGQLNYLRNDGWLQENGGIVTVWDTVGFLKINYAYNAQNQLIQMTVEGKGVTDNSSPIRYRYRFTLDSDGKVLEEIKDMIYIYRPPAWINLTKTVYTYQVTRTDEPLSENLLTVSPNPVRDGQLRIALQDANFKIEFLELYDLYGRLILNQKIDNESIINLNLNNFNNGNYFLRVKTNQGWISKKILVH